jgi:conjugation system TraG family ATPase
VSVSYAAPVSLMLNCNHLYNQYIFIEDKQGAFPKLEQRATQMRSLANFGKDNEVNAMLLNQYLSYAAETGFTPVRSHFNIQVWTDEKGRLPVLRNLVSSAIARMGVRPRENTKDALGLFWAGIPGNAADMPGEDKYWSFVPQSVCLLNQETNYYDSVSQYGVKLVERMSGKPLLVDLSDYPMKKGWVTNRNKFILGPSGSGKSFFTNHALRSFHVQGSHAVIVDVGHSYRGLCDMLGGLYLTYSEEEPINFNPFFIENRALPDVEKKEAIKVLLQTLWKRSDERQTMSEYTALSDAVTQYFEAYLPNNTAVFPCFNSFYEFMQTDFPRYLEEHKVQIGYFDYDNFIYVLRPFYRGGEYETLLNSQANLDLLNVPFIVFELDNIKDHPILFPVVTIIIMDTFISKMRKLSGVRKIILIEEAWKAIMRDGMAEYIKYLYKTVRKFLGEAWIVTQEVDDIIGNKIVKDSIINNADTKILLDQRKYRNKFSHVKDLLALTDKEKDLCLSLNQDLDPKRKYKEVFISWGGQESKVYGVEVSTEEYLAYSTEQTEKLRLEEKVAALGGNYDLALRDYADELRAGR